MNPIGPYYRGEAKNFLQINCTGGVFKTNLKFCTMAVRIIDEIVNEANFINEFNVAGVQPHNERSTQRYARIILLLWSFAAMQIENCRFATIHGAFIGIDQHKFIQENKQV